MKNQKAFFLLVLILIFTASCMGQPTSNRKLSKLESATNGPTPTPTFSTGNNYFQNGSSIINSTLALPVNFTDSFYVRGSQVHYFITTGNVGNPQCLVSYFPSSLGKKFLVLLANPRFLLNQSTGVKEYYYLVEPSNIIQNKNFCQKTGLINKLSTLDSTATIAYSLSEVCPTCLSSMNLTSTGINFYSSGGTAITDITTSYLYINLVQGSSSSSGAQSCSASTQCQSLGYKCCSMNQCVNDGQTKPGIDTSSSEYKQALQDVLSNPSNALKYPNFFYICAADPQVTPTPTATPNSQNAANDRLAYLRELYLCTTLLKGEMSVCTATFKEASTSGAHFRTGLDDRNFRDTQPTNSPLPNHSLYKVTHAGETLYENQTFTPGPQGFNIGVANLYAGNDTLTDYVEILLTHAKKTSAPNDDLKISYKIDGSCKKINSQLAQCTKYYTQGQPSGYVDDHYPGTDTFLIPTYADLTRSLKVEVDDVFKTQDSEWTLQSGSPSSITFIGDGQQVFDTQIVKITFYVSLSSFPNLMISKEAALSQINLICNCGGSACTLKPEYSGTEIINYTCVYPGPDVPPPPMQQTVMLSSKNVPLRYYDSSGVYHSTINSSTPEQEGTKFEYTKGDLAKPNNISGYIGFNEIYGPLNLTSGSAKPALEVKVIQGKIYDMYADNGSFSTCYNCGNDYYNSGNRYFPTGIGGGGLNPDLYKNVTDKFQATANSYRDDDFLFGRACFIPATMIPWTHRTVTPRDSQRKARQAAQHFLFANGYQRDWYGFDYGSVIASFDGVAWFSVGAQRRILAKSNKLFLAVNAYYGDLTTDSTYRVTINESGGISGNSIVTTDIDSDGAQCQKYHLCQNDSDCITQLGWEYSCQAVSNMQTTWPVFDVNALETPGKEKVVRLTQLIDNVSGSKRCVYRAKGSPCHQNYDNATEEDLTYDHTSQLGTHGCTSNNYCQLINEGLPASKFNNRISRYGKSPQAINSAYSVNYNTFGLGAKFLGRPLNYNGSDSIPSESSSNLSHNHVTALCLPGRNTGTGATRLITASKSTPSSEHMGDQVNNQGMTLTGQTAQSHYLSSCPVLDSYGNYLIFKDSFIATNPTLSNTELLKFAGAQVIPSNSITYLQNSLDSSQYILKNFVAADGEITRPYLQENRCLRAAGAVCHSDLDCAPSKFISDKMSLIIGNTTNSGLPSEGLNMYELKFWQENLVCGQVENKTILDSQNRLIVNPNYDLKKNRCCRETGKNFTVGTFTATLTYSSTTPFFAPNTIPGIETDLNSKARYSRWSPVNYEMKDATSSANFPPLFTLSGDGCDETNSLSTCLDISFIYKQFNTFAQIAERTSCSGHWVRNFHSTIGGGHTWESSKAQNIPLTSLRCYNWLPCTPGISCSSTSPINGATGFSCSHTESPTDANCLIRSVTSATTHKIFDWFNSLEILGVPQATVASEDFDDIRCEVNPFRQDLVGTNPAPNILKLTATTTAAYYGSNDDGTETGRFYSGDRPHNFFTDQGELKMIFSPDTVSCCKPAGTTMPTGADASQCCTGYIDENNRCLFKDYINLSVYYNRFISSAAKELPITNFNERTGFVKDKSTVMRLACTQKVCKSGFIGTGITYNKYKVPGHETNSTAFVYRFLDSERDNENGFVTLYKSGLRWNDDVYCIPSDLASTPPEGMSIMACGP